MLRCRGGELYTGIATDPERRLREHLSGGTKGAKFTRSHPPKRVEAVFETVDKSSASALEYRIKKMPREKKERLIESGRLEDFFKDRLSVSDYELCPVEYISHLSGVIEAIEKTENDPF